MNSTYPTIFYFICIRINRSEYSELPLTQIGGFSLRYYLRRLDWRQYDIRLNRLSDFPLKDCRGMTVRILFPGIKCGRPRTYVYGFKV
jgi:hypothetical protein